jgi:tetratricopeptide (TPR) repeat protein
LLPQGLVYHRAMRGLEILLIPVLVWPSLASAQEGTVSDTAQAGAAVERLSPAQLRSDQLDALFARLYTSEGDEGSRIIEKKIWDMWMMSDSPTAEALLQQGARAMNEGAPREALSILNRLVGTYPEFPEAWNKRATLYYLMKRDDEALLDIQRVLDLEPRHFGALSGRGLIYQRQKKYGLALESLRQALKINPGMEAVKAAVKDLERLEQGI